MKWARWVVLALLVCSFICSMWMIVGVAVNLLLPTAMPQGGLTRSESLVGAVLCLIGPVTLVIAGGIVWWFGVRRASASPKLAASNAPPAQPAPIQINTSVAALDDYMAKMTELIFRQGWGQALFDTNIRGIVQAETRRILAVANPQLQGRVLLFLQRAQLLAGVEPISLYGIDLHGADLRFADLRGAYLVGVDLRQALLTGADLRGCNLSEADLRGADLRIAQLDGARLDRANLQQARFHRASLRGASLHQTNLQSANLWQADLEGTHLTDHQTQAASPPSRALLPQSERG
jgi:hypothetical protein